MTAIISQVETTTPSLETRAKNATTVSSPPHTPPPVSTLRHNKLQVHLRNISRSNLFAFLLPGVLSATTLNRGRGGAQIRLHRPLHILLAKYVPATVAQMGLRVYTSPNIRLESQFGWIVPPQPEAPVRRHQFGASGVPHIIKCHNPGTGYNNDNTSE